jgi:hypothetical protein
MENVSGGESEANRDGCNGGKRKAANLVGGELAARSLPPRRSPEGRGGAARTGGGREGGSESKLGSVFTVRVRAVFMAHVKAAG